MQGRLKLETLEFGPRRACRVRPFSYRPVVTALVLAFLLFPFLSGPHRAVAEDAAISLVQTIFLKEYEGVDVQVEEYQVQEGDSLAKILRQRQVVGPGPVPGRILDMILTFNPQISNPNLILPGQKLVMPTGPVEGLPASPPPAAEADAGPAEIQEDQYQVILVEEGESLSKLLRRQGLPDAMIFNEFINLTLRLNPQITDPNLIYAGQRIKLPKGSARPEAALLEKPASASIVRPIRPKTPPTSTRVKPKPKPKPKPEEKPTIALPPPELPPSQTVATRTALGLIFTRIGERYLSKGQHFLPLKTGGQITLSPQAFPIIEFRTGHRVVLDLDRRLPEEMVGLIRTNWPNYTIFRAQPGEHLSELLERLFKLAQYHKVRGRGDPWVLNRDVRISIGADWIIWPTQKDWSQGRAVVITLPASLDQGTSPEVAAYLDGLGIKVIDFHARGSLIGPEPSRAQNSSTLETEDLVPPDYTGLVQALLDLVGQKYELNLNIPLMQSTSSGQDFNFTVMAPIYFSRGGKNYVVAVDGITTDLKTMLEEHGFTVILRAAGEGPEPLAKKLLTALGVDAHEGWVINGSTRADNRNIKVTLPGLLFSSGGRRLLLTPGRVPPALAPLVAESGLKIVVYRMSGQS